MVTRPFDVSSFTWYTSGAFSAFFAGAASFFAGSGDEHPISVRPPATTIHALRVIIEEYAMPLRRFRVVLRPLLERRIPRRRLPHPRTHLAPPSPRGRPHPRPLPRHRLPRPPAR